MNFWNIFLWALNWDRFERSICSDGSEVVVDPGSPKISLMIIIQTFESRVDGVIKFFGKWALV